MTHLFTHLFLVSVTHLFLSSDYHVAVCIILKTDGTTESDLDGREVPVKNGPSSLEKFCFSKYPKLWEKVDKEIHPSKYSAASDVDSILGGTYNLPAENYKQMAAVHREECDLELIQWFMDHDRCNHMAQDEGFGHFVEKIQKLPGLYQPPDQQALARGQKRQATKGQQVAKEWVLRAKSEGRKISIAGDIWTDGEISILAVMGYIIFDGWIWSRQVLAVVEFSKIRHTGSHIKKQTSDSLKEVGMADAFDEVWRKVSDAGSNMVNGWNGFDGGNQTCADHKIERSTALYVLEPEIKAMSTKRHKAAKHMKYSTVSGNVIKASQQLLGADQNKATRSNATRWRSHHAEARWFRIHKDDMADAKYMSDNEDLAEKLLTSHEQLLNDEEESVLSATARVSLGLETDQEPTISLVLPYTDSMMYHTNPANDVQLVTGGTRKHDELAAATQYARTDVYNDFRRRWVDDIDEDYLRTLQIATFCDPRHKSFKLRNLSRSARSTFKKDAIRYAKDLYDMEYAPRPSEPVADCSPGAAAAANETASRQREKHMRKSITVDVADLLGRADEDDSDSEEETDEWEQYVKLPEVKTSVDLLQWWLDNEATFPNVAKMAKQVLGCPACSAGVERLFSKAGRNHTDLQSNMGEHCMRNVLFGYNCSRQINKRKKD